MRGGIIKLQALVKMKKQKSIYGDMKEEMFRRAENERRSRQMAKERQALRQQQETEAQEIMERERAQASSRQVAGVNHLEIPAELAFVFR